MRTARLLCLPLLLAAILLQSCASRVPPRRTLPEWVAKVNVPMFVNSTAVTGLEELGAQYTNEFFLTDGRLKIVPKHDADLIVQVFVEEYLRSTDKFESDRFPERSLITVTGRVRLYEPSDMATPFIDLGLVTVEASYLSDYRRTFVTLEQDGREQAMKSLARGVVDRVITGYDPSGRRNYDNQLQPNFGFEQRSRYPSVETIRSSPDQF